MKTLAAIGRYLVDIQGQNDAQQLLNPEEHLPLLDAFGDEKITQFRNDYQELFQKFRSITTRIRNIQTSQQEITQRLDLLKFQQEELQEANLQPNEENDLLDARDKLRNFKKIADRLQLTQTTLSGEQGGAIDSLAEAVHQLQDIAEYDDQYAELAKTISEAYYTAQDVVMLTTISELTYDEAELIRIDDRSADSTLERKMVHRCRCFRFRQNRKRAAYR